MIVLSDHGSMQLQQKDELFSFLRFVTKHVFSKVFLSMSNQATCIILLTVPIYCN